LVIKINAVSDSPISICGKFASYVLGSISTLRSIKLANIQQSDDFDKNENIYKNDEGDINNVKDQINKLTAQIDKVLNLKTKLLSNIKENKLKLERVKAYDKIVGTIVSTPASASKLETYINTKQAELKKLEKEYKKSKTELYADNGKVVNATTLLERLEKDVKQIKDKIVKSSKGGRPSSMSEIINRIDNLNSIAEKEGASLIKYGNTAYRIESEYKALKKELDDCKTENKRLEDSLALCQKEKVAGLGAKESELNNQINGLRTQLASAGSLARDAMSKADEAFTKAGQTDSTEMARIDAEEAKRLAKEAQLKAETDAKKRKQLEDAIQQKEKEQKDKLQQECNKQKLAIETVLLNLQNASNLKVPSDKLNKYPANANKAIYTTFWRELSSITLKTKDCTDPKNHTSINIAQLQLAKKLEGRKREMEALVKQIIEETSQVGFVDCSHAMNQLQAIYDHLNQRSILAKKIADSIQTKIVNILNTDPELAKKRFNYLSKNVRAKGDYPSNIPSVVLLYNTLASLNQSEINQAKGLLSEFKELYPKIKRKKI